MKWPRGVCKYRMSNGHIRGGRTSGLRRVVIEIEKYHQRMAKLSGSCHCLLTFHFSKLSGGVAPAATPIRHGGRRRRVDAAS